MSKFSTLKSADLKVKFNTRNAKMVPLTVPTKAVGTFVKRTKEELNSVRNHNYKYLIP
jgi:hypothetical protein